MLTMSAGRGICCNGVCKCDIKDNGFQYRSNPMNEEMHDCDCEPAEEVCREVRLLISFNDITCVLYTNH